MTDWVEKELGKVLTLNYGWSLPEKNRVTGVYPVYGSNGIVGSHNMPLVASQGLIIGRKGSAGNVHYSCIPFCPIDTTFFIRPDDTSLEIEFLYFLLLHINLKRVLGDVGVPGLNREVAYKEKVRYPIDNSEQRRIARVLAGVQTAIEQQVMLINHTLELKSSLMRKLFTEGLRGENQKETEIGLVPESWDVVELERVSEKPQYGFTESAQGKGTAQFLRITDIQDFGVNWTDVPFCECPKNLINKYLLENGDLVFARIGATTGKSYVIKKPPKAVFASYLIRIRTYYEKLDSGFLGFYCQTKQYWQQIDAHKGNNLKGGVNSGILQKLLVPLPTLEEQQEINQVFTVLDNKINIAQKKVLMLEELFRTLLHQLMTGQKRVNEIDLPGLS